MFVSYIVKIIIFLSLFFSQAHFSENGIKTSNISDWEVLNKIELENGIVDAEKAIVVLDNEISYYSLFENEKQSIASITKLMTALVFLDRNIDLNTVYTISSLDQIDGGKRHFFPGEEIILKDVLYSALVASDNEAAAILAKATGLSEDDFMSLMNKKARSLAMFNSSFSDPTGLSSNNISTAYDVYILFKNAWKNETIKEALSLNEYTFSTLQGREKKVISTDSFLLENANSFPYLEGGKTGYIDEAGYCFVGSFKIDEKRSAIIVVLNSETKNSRFTDSLQLARELKELK